MVDPVKEFGDVYVHHPIFARLDVSLCCVNRIVGTFARSKTETPGLKRRVEDGLEHLQKHLLNPSVEHRWYAQESNASVRFGYFHPPHRAGDVGPCQKLVADSFPVRSDVVA